MTLRRFLDSNALRKGRLCPILPRYSSFAGKAERNKVIYDAHGRYGHTLKEIADPLGIHYATVSRIVKKMTEAHV